MADRVLMIGLDGYESSIGERLMDEGRMPNLQAVREASARWLIDDRLNRKTGLAWQQFSSGLAPAESGRWSAVVFDAARYATSQAGSVSAPFTSQLSARTVVFDVPYFDLSRDPACRGAVGWGAHDPGVLPQSRPIELRDEMRARFGPYKASKYIYSMVWADPDETRKAGQLLAEAVDQRTEAMVWLIGERLPGWELAISVVSELHSAIEALWHGMDEAHPLHRLPSAAPAREGMEKVYEALDRHVGALRKAAPDADLVCYAPHGMGGNNADAPAFLLLPELLYRLETGKTLFETPAKWRDAPDGVPLLPPGVAWDATVRAAMRGGSWMRLADRLQWIRYKLGNRVRARLAAGSNPERRNTMPIRMAATRYARDWPKMRYFGVPAYYDARIRINLAGREAGGIVPLRDYAAVIEELSDELRRITDPRSGKPAIAEILTPVAADPLAANGTQADVIANFNGAPLALFHPGTGTVGPVPYRRTGGHTGNDGVLYVAGKGIPAGDRGTRASADLPRTLAALLGEELPAGFSGTTIEVPGRGQPAVEASDRQSA